MEGNILFGGLDDLKLVKESVMELNGYKDRTDALNADETRLEKEIKTKEKVIADEYQSTTKKRKDEIETTYNDQIEKTRARIKKINGKKEKSKNKKVIERIDDETSDLREVHRQLVLDGKNIMKQNKLPFYCNTKLFFALYMPRGIVDVFIIILSLAIVLLAVPCGIYFFCLPEQKMIYLITIYAVTVIVCGGLYMMIDHNFKDRKREALVSLLNLRGKIDRNKKERNIIKKHIIKDKDESQYGLEDFDKELQELDLELNNIVERKNNALLVFENTTKFAIREEINVRFQDELSNLKVDYTKVYQEIKDNEEIIKNLAMDIANKYEVFFGKEYMNVEKLELLENILMTGEVGTISEAMNRVKEGNYIQ